MTVTIRAARREEAETLLALYEWLFEPPGRRSMHWEPARALAALGEAIDSDDAIVLLAEHEGESPVGLCVAYQDIHSVRFGRRTWVEDLVVHPAHRSQGIGSHLLTAAREWASEHGAKHFEVDTGGARVDAQRFYEQQNPTYRNVSYGWEL